MKTAKGWVQGYNAQAMVTEDQIIIAGALAQDANDEWKEPRFKRRWASAEKTRRRSRPR